jgi:DNA-binding transcriptional LysR family regulator
VLSHIIVAQDQQFEAHLMKLSTFDLRLFAAIADLGSISAAARALGREKSTVSRDLSGLEDRLGVRLFQRTTRRISTTEAGAILLAYARRVVEEIESAEAAIEALNEVPRGTLRVTAPHAVIRFVLTPRLRAFQDRCPELRVSFDASLRNIDLVEEGIDVALRIGDLPASSLVARKLHDARQILVAAPGYLDMVPGVDTPADLYRHRLIDLAAHVGVANWVLHDADNRPITVPVAPLASAADPGIVLDMVLNEIGIAAVPDIYSASHLRDGSLRRVLPDHDRGHRPIHALYPSRRQLTPKVRAFVDFAAECMRSAAV